MSFNENDINRDTSGKFAEKRGSSADVTLPSDAPSPENGWLLPGTECECDVDYRCPNHDTEAEARWHEARIPVHAPVKTRDAHGFDDRWDIAD